MNLSPHFEREEFELDGPFPDECLPAFNALCRLFLEKVRDQYAEPIVVTSGYRPPAANAAAHGVSHSQHIATAVYCAADWYIERFRGDMRPVFDAIRANPNFPFDQLILEHGANGDVIHASLSLAYNRREALEGETANRSAYQHWPAATAAPEET